MSRPRGRAMHGRMSVAETLVLLHGFARTGRGVGRRCWRELDRERYRPLAPDLRGHGAAAAHRARRLRRPASATCSPRRPTRFALCGYSLGGRIALHVALAAPERVTRLVLVATTAGIEDEGDARRAPRRRRGARRALDARPRSRRSPTAGWRSRCSRARRPRPRGLARGPRCATTRPAWPRSLRGIGTGVMAPLWDRLGELTMPAAVVAGERDAKFVALGERLAAALPATPSSSSSRAPATACRARRRTVVAGVLRPGEMARWRRARTRGGVEARPRAVRAHGRRAARRGGRGTSKARYVTGSEADVPSLCRCRRPPRRATAPGPRATAARRRSARRVYTPRPGGRAPRWRRRAPAGRRARRRAASPGRTQRRAAPRRSAARRRCRAGRRTSTRRRPRRRSRARARPGPAARRSRRSARPSGTRRRRPRRSARRARPRSRPSRRAPATRSRTARSGATPCTGSSTSSSPAGASASMRAHRLVDLPGAVGVEAQRHLGARPRRARRRRARRRRRRRP